MTEKRRALTQDVSFGKAYDARLVRRLAVFFRPHRTLFFLSLLSYPIVSGLHLTQPYLVKVAIDDYLMPKQLEGFGFLILILITVVALEFAARYAQTLLSQLLGQMVTRDLRSALFERLQQADLAYIERNPVGRLMTRVTNDVESLSETFSTGAISIIGDIVTLTGIVVMMLILDVQLTLYAFTVLPVLLAIILIMRKYAREAFRLVRTHLARINGFLNEAISGMALIQVFRQEKTMRQEFEDVNGAYRDANFQAIRYDALTYAVVECISTIATALILLLGLHLFERGAVEIGLFVAFVDYLRRFFTPISELSTKYTILQSAMASAERCVDLLDQEPTILEKKEVATLSERKRSAERAEMGRTALPDRDPRSRALHFEEVSFKYTTAGQQVLKRLTLSVHHGEKVAIVGPTGAGKSTIVKLIARFYDPNEGRVTMNGTDLKDLSLEALRGKLAVVLQDSYLFDGSVRENIAFGASGITEQQLHDAAERTQAIEVIEKLPDGWETPSGERGARFSSGERQLIAFARALALDPEILVLDEATSAVDPETESLIQHGLEALIEDRTAIIIAHRLSTIRRADRIIVLAGGRVVEEGSHEELLERGGIYKNLYELQFADPPVPLLSPEPEPA